MKTEVSEEVGNEPWRVRLTKAFADRPDLEITKFSEELKKHRDYVSRLQKGTANPSPSLLIKICEKLGVSAAYIISGEQPANTKDRVARRVLEADEKTLDRLTQILDLMDADRQDQN